VKIKDNNQPIISLGYLVLAVWSLSGCTKPNLQMPGEEIKTKLHLPVTQVDVRNLSERLSLPGIVFALPDHSVKVAPGIAGKLVDVKVAPGQPVSTGQVIALLDSRQLTGQVNQAHAKVLIAQAGVEQAKTNLLLAQNTEDRIGKLVKQEVGAEKDLVAARSQVETARAQLFSARAQVDDALAAESAIRALLTYSVVKSPIAGIVAQRYLNISDTADTSTPIAEIVDLSDVIIEASLPTSQPAKIHPGQSATIQTMSLPGRHLVGQVLSINPVTDNQGTTVGVRIKAANSNLLLKEGMPVVVTIETELHRQVVTAPVASLVSDPNMPDRKMIYIYKNGKIARVRVTTGIQTDGRVEILSGLTPGEKIVAAGAYGMPDATEVEAESEALRGNSKITSKSD
jgi:RND family efflux transporter MFP subunit